MCSVHKLKLGFHKCDNQEKYLAIMKKGKKVWLCSDCWKKVSDNDKW